jgi:Tfp pilus assembly protein PilP
VYQPEGRRDPFRDVLDARLAEEGSEGIDYAGLKVAGILWHRQGYYALVETADGLGHILRVNDALGKTGRVRQITQEAVVIEVRSKDFGGRTQTRTITLELAREEKLLEMIKRDGKQPATKREEAPPEQKEGSQ